MRAEQLTGPVAHHGEGPVWSPGWGGLRFVDMLAGDVLTLGEELVYHPGDALTPPGEAVDVLCAPICAPWQKISEAIDFALAVGAPRNLAIHDKVYSDLGLGVLDGHLSRFLAEAGQEYARPADGDDLRA